MKIPYFERMQPIELQSLSPSFAIIVPYKGRDTLAVYANRIKGVELYSAYISGLFNKSLKINSLFFSNKSNDNPVNVIFSSEKYPDILYDERQTEEKPSSLILIWSGYCTANQRLRMQRQFDNYSEEIFRLIKELYWINLAIQEEQEIIHDLTYQNQLYNTEEKMKFSLEEYISIIIYQAETYSSEYKANIKIRQKMMFFVLGVYLAIIAITTIYLYFKLFKLDIL